ncbi:zinc ribbon domain-containing protein [uncultured Alsobacter sp.]|uniref:zinc ribbon domain-containing protein n=1 Tax=uncultured Alsobacter sp. TaxID=1748258 RepID=UPI0025EF3D91|nr:zinc ribbon domain-containing protein [uncultured Alsobacter sp.]
MTRTCPYCAEAIQDEAIVCKHCGRDFYLHKPLLDEVETLKARVASLEQELGSLRGETGAPAQEAPLVAASVSSAPRRAYWWPAPILCVAFLLAAHALIVLVLDLRVVNLRIVSLVGPFVFGFLFRRDPRPGLWVDALVATVLSIVAVAGMLAVVARVDGVPVLPSGRIETIETAQYIASIGLGFFAGALARQVILLVWDEDQTRSGALASLARILNHEIFGEEKSTEKRIKKMEGLLTTSLALAAGLISVVMGLGKLFD